MHFIPSIFLFTFFLSVTFSAFFPTHQPKHLILLLLSSQVSSKVLLAAAVSFRQLPTMHLTHLQNKMYVKIKVLTHEHRIWQLNNSITLAQPTNCWYFLPFSPACCILNNTVWAWVCSVTSGNADFNVLQGLTVPIVLNAL